MVPIPDTSDTPHAGSVTDLAREVLRSGGLTVLDLTPLGDAENVTFRVDTPNGVLLLRLKPPGRLTSARMVSEFTWLRALRRDTPLRVPAPRPFPDGRLVRSFQGPPRAAGTTWLAALLDWVEGDVLGGTPTSDDTRAVGRFAAALHEHALCFTLPEEFTRPHLGDEAAFRAWPPDLLDGTHLTRVERRAITLARRAARTALAAAQRGEVRSHLLHIDLHPGNVVRSAGGIGGIDFDDCQFGPALYDLAAMLAHLGVGDGDGALRAAFLAGYEEIRPLWPRERELLGAFVRLR
ncbi:phosphotransferase enzyme family protein, partial [Deinococcus pimensis]|uniref:phosphotransferase enzyme family protein n=1 Tax=Deinococcus pimensis TaxID=309888 RepID=UPI0004896CE5